MIINKQKNLLNILILFLIVNAILIFLYIFAGDISLQYQNWRKCPLIHDNSVYSSQHAHKAFYLTTIVWFNIYLLTFLFLKNKKNIFFAVLACIIAFLITETALKTYIYNSNFLTEFIPHPTRFYTTRSNLKLKEIPEKELVPTDKNGFRYYGELTIDKHPAEKRIFIIGDSSSFGHYLKYEDTFSSVLEQKLLNDNINAKVILAACPGHTTYQGLLIIKESILKFKPDIIIVSYNNDPAKEFKQEKDRAFIHNKFEYLLFKLLYKSDYFLLAQKVISDWQMKLFPAEYKPVLIPRVSLEDYKNNIKEIINLGKQYNFTPVFLRMPYNYKILRNSPELNDLYIDQRYPSSLIDLCKKDKLNYIDFDILWGEENKDEALFDKFAHFHPSKYGHLKMAEALYPEVKEILKNE